MRRPVSAFSAGRAADMLRGDPMGEPTTAFESFWTYVERLAAAPPGPALLELARDGSRREWGFSEVVQRAGGLSGELSRRGVVRGDVVLTLVGNRPEWVLAMLACWRMGAVVLPCNEMLRAKDLAHRVKQARPAAVICDERNLEELSGSGWDGETLVVPDDALFAGAPAAAAVLGPDDPALMIFTSGTAGDAKAVVHPHRCLPGQRLQADHWFGAQPGELAWCTAASGWSKSARNVFLTPWLCGATAMLHDERFDPAQRMALIEREGVNVLCMAPTEYRVIAKRLALEPIASLRRCVSAGEALGAEILDTWREGTGTEIHDGYGQTETGAVTAVGPGMAVKPASMGPPLPGVAVRIVGDELQVRPETVPTFFSGYGRPGAIETPQLTEDGWWQTGDLVEQDEDGYLWFQSRDDDIILSAGYRIGPFEVESALSTHPAVAEAAAVAEPDEERGAVVRAVIVLKGGFEPGDALAAELQEHVKQVTAPYKYPRIVEFTDALPKTASGKVRRGALRHGG